MGKPTLFYREGGTIPAMALLKNVLDIDMTMFSFGLPDDRIHAPNERYAYHIKSRRFSLPYAYLALSTQPMGMLSRLCINLAAMSLQPCMEFQSMYAHVDAKSQF